MPRTWNWNWENQVAAGWLPQIFPSVPVESNGYMLALPHVLDICLVVALRAEIVVF